MFLCINMLNVYIHLRNQIIIYRCNQNSSLQLTPLWLHKFTSKKVHNRIFWAHNIFLSQLHTNIHKTTTKFPNFQINYQFSKKSLLSIFYLPYSLNLSPFQTSLANVPWPPSAPDPPCSWPPPEVHRQSWSPLPGD